MASARHKLAEVTKLVGEMRGDSDLPAPLARTAEEGMRMSRAIIGRYMPNFAHFLTWVAIGDSGVSPHTRWNAANTALSLFELTTPEPAVATGNTLPTE